MPDGHDICESSLISAGGHARQTGTEATASLYARALDFDFFFYVAHLRSGQNGLASSLPVVFRLGTSPDAAALGPK